MKIQSPLEAYKYLPGTNCKECGEETCMAFASKLIDRSRKLEECKEILDESYKDEYEELTGLLAPEIKEITVGTGEKAVKIGGEDVIYRHELTFFDAPPFAYDVTDAMDEKEIVDRVNYVQNYKKFYVGNFLTLEMIAIRSVSDDPKKFSSCVRKVAETTEIPVVLMSFNPDVLEAGLKVISERRPLIYAATVDNWQRIAELVDKYKVPVVLFSPDLDKLSSLVKTFLEMGMEDLVLDPGTYASGKQLKGTFDRFIKLRRSGIKEGNRDITFPLMCIPMQTFLANKKGYKPLPDELIKTLGGPEDGRELYQPVLSETTIGNISIIKYADIVVWHNIEAYSILPSIHLRFNIYTDPRTPVSVEPIMREVGHPDENSPVFFTTNFALTYFTVFNDLDSNGIDSYLLVVDTAGIGVQSAIAGGQLNAGKIKDAVEESKVKEKVKHNTLTMPGYAARLMGDVEDETGMTVLVGPIDSGRIPGFLDEHWPPKSE